MIDKEIISEEDMIGWAALSMVLQAIIMDRNIIEETRKQGLK